MTGFESSFAQTKLNLDSRTGGEHEVPKNLPSVMWPAEAAKDGCTKAVHFKTLHSYLAVDEFSSFKKRINEALVSGLV